MVYRVEKEKISKLKAWGIAFALAFIYSIKFIGWTGFLYITYNFFANTISNTFNFTRVEFLILISNFLLVFVLLILYFSLKQSKTEEVILNEKGILFYKMNIFLLVTKSKVNWSDIKLIEIRSITYWEDKFKNHIQFKLITKSDEKILLPKQPPNNLTYEFRVALDEFVEKYNPEIKIANI
jgi:hypothetical protein